MSSLVELVAGWSHSSLRSVVLWGSVGLVVVATLVVLWVDDARRKRGVYWAGWVIGATGLAVALSGGGLREGLATFAGIMLLGPALDAPIDDWERMVALNVQGSLYVTHAALPHLVRAAEDSPRQVADLVNISSTAGRVARPGGSVYSLTKFGLGAFT